jgi:glycyl-tRNA synthetase beta chain
VHDATNLLVEIGTEELPPAALQRLSEAFAKGFARQLEQHRLKCGGIEPFATPRRLALLVRGLATHQPDQEVVRKGPTLKSAFDENGQPTRAASGFARSCGVPLQQIQQEKTAKGAWLVFRNVQRGQSTTNLIVDLTSKALQVLPIPKRMRWGQQDHEFVRPVHWVALVFGQEPVKGRLFGIESGGSTRGHRFHSPAPISIPSASKYADLLRSQGMVEPSFARRRDLIRDQVDALAREIGGQAVVESDLLDEVTGLCEWPCAIMGAFDEEFLEVPSEVLVETMQKHQKYFPIVSSNGELLPHFITISNIQSRDPSQVRAGNERVIRPRFSDAAFFWKQDLKQPLESFAPKLKKVVFQEKLGTLAERSARVAQVSRHIAGVLGIDEEMVGRAADLAKCDLLTQMIAEFPTLQGIMGRHYAEKSGEDPCIVSAMEEQYLPRHSGDSLPQSKCGLVLSIADKVDTLVGIFAIGERPTGDKDPYALRRASIGLLRILIETPLPLDLKDVLDFSAEELRDKVDARFAAAEVFTYSMERLKAYYDDQNIEGDVVDSVLTIGLRVPSDIHRRVLAVESFRLLPEARALTSSNKRIANILRKSQDRISGKVDISLLKEEAEQRLQKRAEALESAISPLLDEQDYRSALKALSGLRKDIDIFFEQVMVMTEKHDLRSNRLGLLRSVQSLFLKVADISLLK